MILKATRLQASKPSHGSTYATGWGRRTGNFLCCVIFLIPFLLMLPSVMAAAEETAPASERNEGEKAQPDEEAPAPAANLLDERKELVSKGYQADSEGRPGEAADFFEAALALPLTEEEEAEAKPDRFNIRMSRYYSLKNANDMEAALSYLISICKDHPENEAIHRDLGYFHMSRKEEKEAEKIFDGLCERNPKSRPDCIQAAYLHKENGDPDGAAGIFKVILVHYPEDTAVRKELAYLLLSAGEKDKAREQFEIIRGRAPGDLGVRQQLAYMYLAKSMKSEALTELRYVTEKDPGRHALRLEMAYLLWDMDSKKESKKEFRKVADQEEDMASKLKAEKALENIRASEPSIFFGDVYIDAFFSSRFINFIFTGRVREGIKPIQEVPWRLYLGLRITRDVRSKGGEQPEIYADNFMIPAAGMEFSPYVPGLNLFFEVGPAIALYDRKEGPVELDMRGGVNYYLDWMNTKPKKNPKGALIWPLTYFGELYTDFIWYSRFEQNVIGFIKVNNGINLFQVGMLLDQLYLRTALTYDIDGIYYNNIAEVGPGMRLKPWDWLGLSFYIEYALGFYIPRDDSPYENPDDHFKRPEYYNPPVNYRNPYTSPYHDVRIGVLFYHSW